MKLPPGSSRRNLTKIHRHLRVEMKLEKVHSIRTTLPIANERKNDQKHKFFLYLQPLHRF